MKEKIIELKIGKNIDRWLLTTWPQGSAITPENDDDDCVTVQGGNGATKHEASHNGRRIIGFGLDGSIKRLVTAEDVKEKIAQS